MDSSTKADFAILIPTYNGTSFLRRAITAHCELVLEHRLAGVELVVSDNASHVATEEVVRDAMKLYPFLRYIRQPRHYDTAEEHVWHACRSVDYEWVWLFGDDDVPLPGSTPRLVKLARTGHYDFLFSNMRSLMVETGAVHRGRNGEQALLETSVDRDVTISELVAELGFQTSMACFSATVLRRRMIADQRYAQYLSLSPIYSHVATYLEVFKESACRYCGTPALDYRLGATGPDNWERLAARRNHTLHAPWTIGIIRLFARLVAEGVVERDYFFSIVEHTPEARFVLWTHVVSKLMEEIDQALRAKDPVLILGEQEMEEIKHFFASNSRSSAPLEALEIVNTVHAAARQALLVVRESDVGTELKRAIIATTLRFADARFASVRMMLPSASGPMPFGASLTLGSAVAMADPHSQRFVNGGFSNPESWGCWTDGPRAGLRFRLETTAPDRNLAIALDVSCIFPQPGATDAGVYVAVNGEPPEYHRVRPGQSLVHDIPAASTKDGGDIRIMLGLMDPKHPDQEPLADQRELGIGIVSFRVDYADRIDRTIVGAVRFVRSPAQPRSHHQFRRLTGLLARRIRRVAGAVRRGW